MGWGLTVVVGGLLAVSLVAAHVVSAIDKHNERKRPREYP